ncbi:unnamed protein product [Lactuca virosa]|uniref:Uncharacterized protein n=1 Tax=Lactuca virosa TaxID=75947 RepID=A0AAU9PG49_9ASTR|nr:unnamed protein product [Lactuca virosa]
MDALVEQTQKAKVLHEKLKNAKSDVARLQEEKFSVKDRNSEIHQRLLRIVETRSPPFNDRVHLALCEKLKHVFALLNQIHGVLESGASSKQWGDEEVNVKEDFDQKGNEAYGSRNNGNAIYEEENEENMTEAERAERK